MTEFNLAETVRDVIDTADTADTDQLTEQAFALIPEDEYPAIVRKLLRTYVRNMQGRDWNEPRVPKLEVVGTWVDDDNDPQMLPPVRSRPKPRSRYRAGIHSEIVQAWLDATTDVNGVRKRRGDMTLEDMLVAASVRRELANANSLAADELTMHAALLEEHGVKTLSELPESLLKKLAI